MLLSWLIAQSVHHEPKRRLNEIENRLTDLARLWRLPLPLDHPQELRVSSTTMYELRDWVKADDRVELETSWRLDRYQRAPVIDESVPSGWIRLLFVAKDRACAEEGCHRSK